MKYFKQETNYTCGPACVRMMLSKFGIESYEKDLEQLLETTNYSGTTYDSFNKLAPKFGLTIMKGEGKANMETLNDLQSLIKEGWVVIIAYTIEVPHYSIMLEHNGNHLFLMDPFRGERVAEQLRKFPHMWKIIPEDFNHIPLIKINPSLKSKGWWIAFNKNKDENKIENDKVEA